MTDAPRDAGRAAKEHVGDYVMRYSTAGVIFLPQLDRWRMPSSAEPPPGVSPEARKHSLQYRDRGPNMNGRV